MVAPTLAGPRGADNVRHHCPLTHFESPLTKETDPHPEVCTDAGTLTAAQRSSQTTAKRGCLLINLGSPAAPEPAEIRKFLRSFLSDRRVINLHPVLWQPILNGIILTMRPRRIAPVYKSIWAAEGSPLSVHSRTQEALVQAALGDDVMVRVGMTYAEPTVTSALQEIEAAGVTDLTVINLYPQFTASTVSACYDSVFRYYMKRSYIPTLRIVSNWEVEPRYIEAYAQKLAMALSEHQADAIAMSYHSVPQTDKHVHQLYRSHCSATSAAIITRLKELLTARGEQLPRVFQTFQSKFGPGKWIGPTTIGTMAALPQQGVRKLLIATPGFISDCIETLDEIAVLNREAFEQAGGEEFHVVPPLNGDREVGPMIADVYRRVNE